MKEFTDEELAYFNGQDGRPAYVAHEGKVYDVSSSKLWRVGKHLKQHDAGNDLTGSFPKAPHGVEVFERVTQVGTMKKTAEVKPEPHVPSWARLLIDFHSHPIFVHFPQAFFVAAPVFLILFYVFQNPYFERSAYYFLICGLVMSPPTYATGLVHWIYKYSRNPGALYKFKIVMPLIMMAYATLVVWRHTKLGVAPPTPVNYSLIIMYLIVVPILTSIGYVGGIIVFGPRKK
jgi:predicted heme/steroid binding protein/uncharacterized membrane protein